MSTFLIVVLLNRAAHLPIERMGVHSQNANLYLEVIEAVLIHDVHSAQLGDREVQEGTTDRQRAISFSALLHLLLGALAVGKALPDRLAHCFRLAQCGNQYLQCCQREGKHRRGFKQDRSYRAGNTEELQRCCCHRSNGQNKNEKCGRKETSFLCASEPAVRRLPR